MNDQEKKLKPVVFVQGEYQYYRQNNFQQNLLLKALQVTSDPKKLREMTGLKTVAEVYRTLDKMSIRKEYHEALLRNGIDLDTIVGGIKEAIDNSYDSAVQLKGYQILLKSLGLDEYKDNAEQAKQTWEELVKQQIDEERITPSLVAENKPYEVNAPEVPDSEKKRREEEKKAGQALYE